ncbi:thiolase C-terminal domain-containing protein [Paraburkholderia diazotrophica]|uniref:Thiolase C-terminal domain-containing protein n=1 Tax=Paraburkholderia diazotrophica TaxID=667676 RepID=A0A1H7CDJ8_9BURK|nr:hypothetical protein SAMN05192539_102079 [Paraburkholderia diazotrophica]
MPTATQFSERRFGDARFGAAEVHDCFTLAEPLIYEAMGLAPRGEGHRVIDEGLVEADGVLPVNLSVGLKAKGHPIVRQGFDACIGVQATHQ